MLVARQGVVADDLLSLEVPTAEEVGRNISASTADVDCPLRIGAQRTCAGWRRRGTAGSEKRLRRYFVFDPIHQGTECISRAWPCATATVTHPRRPEEAIEALQVGKVRLPAAAIVRRHLPVVVDDTARKDELIVAADPCQQLAAVRLELVKWAERIGDVRNVLGAILRHLR